MQIRKIILWPAYFAVDMVISARDLALIPFGWPARKIRDLSLVLVAIAFVFWFMGWNVTGVLQVLVLSLVILVPVMMYGGWKENKPSKWAIAGAVAYTLDYFISNSFVAASWLLSPLPIEFAEPWRILPEAYAMILKEHISGQPTSAYGFALRIDQSNKRLLVVVYCLTTLFALSKQDIRARMIWTVLVIANGFQWLEHLECKFWRDPFGSTDLHLANEWGIEVSRYACGRAFTRWAPFAAPIITSLYLIWINSRRRFH